MNDLQIAKTIAQKIAPWGRAYFTGGFVRDGLLGRHSRDMDMEIWGIPSAKLLPILQDLGEVRQYGESYPIFSLSGSCLEISVPHEPGGRETPFMEPKQAAARRDLTVNALMQDVLTGEIIDFFGGREDLQKGILRYVDADTFSADPLRVFRTAQLAARLGFSPTEQTLALCRTLHLDGLAPERVEGELKKALLRSEKPSVFFEILRQCGQLGVWFAQVEQLSGIPQNPVYHPEGDVWVHTMAVLDAAACRRDRVHFPYGYMLSALVHDFGKITATEKINGVYHAYCHEFQGIPIIRKFLGKLTGDEKLTRYVLNMAKLHMKPSALAIAKARIRSTNRLFDEAIEPEDLIQLAAADCYGIGGERDYTENERFLTQRLALYREIMARPCVTGKDLLEAGFPAGAYFGEVLAFAHKLRLAGLDRETALPQVLAMAAKRKKEMS